MRNLTEEKVFEAFGLEAPVNSGAGENVQEVAAPASQTEQRGSEEGAREQEIAEPAASEEGSVDTSQPAAAEAEGEEPNDGDDGAQPEKQTQSPAQRRENAARRRAQEQQAAIDQAVSAALQAERERANTELQDFFAKVGLRNPATGEVIKSMDEFRQWQEQTQAQQLEQQLKAGKLTAENLNAVISNHPAVKQAQTLIQQQAAQQKQEQETARRAQIEAEIAEIGKVDPSIKSVADLLNMPNAKEFYELVQRGYSFKDAHFVLNRDKIETARVEAARQQAVNNVQSKDHLKSAAGSRGTGAVAVPEADLKWFQTFNPNASQSDIQAFYNKHYKK